MFYRRSGPLCSQSWHAGFSKSKYRYLIDLKKRMITGELMEMIDRRDGNGVKFAHLKHLCRLRKFLR